jgi:Undecaprenyl-phosphate galactose phosphotransferase WbaP
VRKILAEGSLIPNLVVLNSNMMMPTLWVDSFEAAGLTGIHVRDRMLLPFQCLFKRSVDFVLAAILLAATAPLFLILIFWARKVSKGPVFYCHQRIGRFGKPFGVWKFTTMVPDAPAVLKEYLAANPAAKREWETFHKLKDDPRVIPGYGRFLRRTSLDELPQLLNVLTGEMSMVGPRPVYTRDEIEMYGELYPLYMRVRPGLSGLWQVSGRNNTTFADKVCMDTYYVMNWSLWLDYFILLRTVRTVLFREGSY